MTKQNLIFIAACLTVGLSLQGEVEAQPTKDVNVVNEPNVSVLNNVDVNVTNGATNPIPVTVQNGSNGAAEKDLVEIAELVSNGEGFKSVYIVPIGKQLLIKDVTISAISKNCSPAIGRPGGSQPKVIMQASLPLIISPAFGGGGNSVAIGATFTKTYETGIKFDQEETVSLLANCGNSVFFELRGFQTDMN